MNAAAHSKTLVNRGVYIVQSEKGLYIGISNNITRRLGQHVANGFITPAARAAAERIAVHGPRINLRIAEQKLINQHGLGNLANKINSIAERYWKQHGI